MSLLTVLFFAGCDRTTAINDAARTLETCETTLSDDLPAFFLAAFRCVDATVAGDEVALTTRNLPPHPSPYYPESDPNWVAFDERGGTHHQNPNVLVEQVLTVRVPSAPVPRGIEVTAATLDRSMGTSGDEYPGGPVGIALDGTALYAAIAPPGDDLAAERFTFDTWEAHPTQTGSYHHHGANPAALAVLAGLGWVDSTVPGAAEVEIYGVMCDGTVVLGCTEADGAAPDTSDLDAQGGHVHTLAGPDGTWFEDRYHTHACDAFGYDYTPELQYYEGCVLVGL